MFRPQGGWAESPGGPSSPPHTWLGGAGELTLCLLRYALCFIWVAFISVAYLPAFVVLLPWPALRISLANRWANTVGRTMLQILGVKLDVDGWEHLHWEDAGHPPRIYVSNHTSSLDVIAAMALMPPPTSVLAKREILLSPFALVYLLSGNHVVDKRGGTGSVKAFRRMTQKLIEQKVSIFIWPEGTRSKTGRLRRFKKGVVHMACQTRFHIVPVCVVGAHLCWEKGPFLYKVRPRVVQVKILPPISTTDWTVENMDRHLSDLQELFVQHLPPAQQMGPAAAPASATLL